MLFWLTSLQKYKTEEYLTFISIRYMQTHTHIKYARAYICVCTYTGLSVMSCKTWYTNSFASLKLW